MAGVQRAAKGRGKGTRNKPENDKTSGPGGTPAVNEVRKLSITAKKLGASARPAAEKVPKQVANLKPHDKRPNRATAAERQREAQKRFRANMRRQGMKLMQIWVPDTGTPGFAEEARRQSALIAKAAGDPRSDEAQMNRELNAWADAITEGEPDYDWGPDGPPK
jgi:hypothetical protein